jgi:hypothetical protein
MTGIYRVDESNYDSQWKFGIIRITVVLTIVYLLFIIVILAGNEADKISLLFTVLQ